MEAAERFPNICGHTQRAGCLNLVSVLSVTRQNAPSTIKKRFVAAHHASLQPHWKTKKPPKQAAFV